MYSDRMQKFRHNQQAIHRYGEFKDISNVIDFFAKRIRKYDIIFRYGGDEFLLMLPETNIADASQLLERIRLDLKMSPSGTITNKKYFQI